MTHKKIFMPNKEIIVFFKGERKKAETEGKILRRIDAVVQRIGVGAVDQ